MSDAVRRVWSAGRVALGRLGVFGGRRSSEKGPAAPSGPRGGLFRKYVLLIVGLVSLVLLINSALDFWFAYSENKAALFRIQQEKAASAAQRIGQFVDEIERQLGWTTAPQWAASPLEQRRFDYVRLLRQVPAITELVQLGLFPQGIGAVHDDGAGPRRPQCRGHDRRGQSEIDLGCDHRSEDRPGG